MDEAAPILNICGQRVGLGPLRREHLPLYVRWLNDLNTSRYLGIPPRPMTLEQEEAWHERASVDDSRYPFAIYELASGRPIGNCGLHSVDWPNRRTTIGILIGEAEARGQGYGTEAMQQGAWAAANIQRALAGTPMKPFRYKDLGNLATIGRNSAVADIRGLRLTGFIAWLAWALVHILNLIGFRNRVLVGLQWLWGYLTFQRGARLITPIASE